MVCILSIANQKGSIGKTTTLHQSRCRDRSEEEENASDRPGSSIKRLPSHFFSSEEIQSTMYDVFAEHPVEMAKIIKPTKEPVSRGSGAIWRLARLEQQISGQFDAPFKLKDALTPILRDFDYIVLDTPPSARDTHRERAGGFYPLCSCPYRRPILRLRVRMICSRPTAGFAPVPTRI